VSPIASITILLLQLLLLPFHATAKRPWFYVLLTMRRDTGERCYDCSTAAAATLRRCLRARSACCLRGRRVGNRAPLYWSVTVADAYICLTVPRLLTATWTDRGEAMRYVNLNTFCVYLRISRGIRLTRLAHIFVDVKTHAFPKQQSSMQRYCCIYCLYNGPLTFTSVYIDAAQLH
jgi:hypothetical protein